MSTKLRYNDYYNMQDTFDWLYQRSLEDRTKGLNLYKIITSEENILLAYRTIKSNTGSKTSGTDKLTIKDYKLMDKDEFIKTVRQDLSDFIPQSVKRVQIPKTNGKMRPLGIPTMRDRLIQQMFLQVLTPICEAKFFCHSYGFRENRSAHNALFRCMALVNKGKCHYVVDVDIKGFFDNVNHTILLRQLYSIGIKDRRVLTIIRKMLKAPVVGLGIQDKGTPQGAILSPLLSNVVLTDLDNWVTSQWEEFPSRHRYVSRRGMHAALRKNTKLKEMHIVRYADDFKIFTKDYKHAIKIFHAVQGYLSKHLKLDISKEKSKITNLRKRSSEFLGFEIKAVKKRKGFVANTHVSKQNQQIIRKKVKEQLQIIQKNPCWKSVADYNAYVLGVHTYYKVATHVTKDFSKIAYSLLYTSYNRLKKIGKYEVPRSPPDSYKKLYKGSRRTFKVSGVYLYPLSNVQWKIIYGYTQEISNYTKSGRQLKYAQLKPTVLSEIRKMLRIAGNGMSLEYADNRISKYSMQNGRCIVLKTFLNAEDLHCHHILPKHLGGTDNFSNLVVLHKDIHRLIHLKEESTIELYLSQLNLGGKQIEKINSYREKCNLAEIY